MKRSLLLRIGIAMAAIFLLAVIGMLSSVIIAETSEGFAAAINQAGTLRMQSYRLASSLAHKPLSNPQTSVSKTRLLMEEFNQRLFSPRIHNVLDKQPSSQVMQSYRKVEQQWQEKMHPALLGYLDHAEQTTNQASKLQAADNERFYLTNVDEFVDDIHDFVAALEIDAERKNQQIRFIQIVLLILVFLITTFSIYLTKISVLKPLRDLLHCANSARQGDFSARSQYLSEDELGQLGQAFNVMAEDLSRIYADLEARVREKTTDLERRNRSLEVLYTTTRRLSDSSLNEDVMRDVIHDIEELLNIRSGTICLGQPGDKQAFRYASTNTIDVEREDKFNRHCERCLGNGQSHSFQVERQNTTPIQVFSTPIRDQAQQYGVLLVEYSHDMKLEEWQQRLLETVASHIALAINVSHQVAQNRMLSLLEERSVIARELHDSIAQSLSYLKIQVSRLEKTVTEDRGKPDVLAISGVIRSALNDAYRQLRELLTTFRLRINQDDFSGALEETVKEYSSRGDIPIEFINRMANCRFSPNAEIHVIQIIRESLSNVIRHANATRAKILMECDIDGQVTILVEDDGVGMTESGDMMQHYGMPIMKERAEWLGGKLEINESGTGGTRICLTFNIAGIDQTASHDTMKYKLSN